MPEDRATAAARAGGPRKQSMRQEAEFRLKSVVARAPEAPSGTGQFCRKAAA